jgi:ADP-ribose pyrophosphatase YjhB (NUDIX family)
MMPELYVLAILHRSNELLLLLRSKNKSFGAGMYSLVGGKVEQNERALHAIRREVHEEVGLDLPEQAFKLVHTMHRMGPEGAFIALCFEADINSMSPHNREPEQHDAMTLFPLNALPEHMIPTHKVILKNVSRHAVYGEHGW